MAFACENARVAQHPQQKQRNLVLQWMAIVSYVSATNTFLDGHIPLSSKDRVHRWNHTEPDAGKAYIYTGSELSCFGEDDGTSTHCPASKYLLAESP